MERYCFRGKTVKIRVLSHGFGAGARVYLWGIVVKGKVGWWQKIGDSFFEVNMLGSPWLNLDVFFRFIITAFDEVRKRKELIKGLSIPVA
jgi:hypothetical protein